VGNDTEHDEVQQPQKKWASASQVGECKSGRSHTGQEVKDGAYEAAGLSSQEVLKEKRCPPDKEETTGGTKYLFCQGEETTIRYVSSNSVMREKELCGEERKRAEEGHGSRHCPGTILHGEQGRNSDRRKANGNREDVNEYDEVNHDQEAYRNQAPGATCTCEVVPVGVRYGVVCKRVLALVVLSTLLLAACGKQQPPRDTVLTVSEDLYRKSPFDHLIVVGGDSGYPPFEYIDASGKPAGFNIDVIHALARVINLDVRIELGPWDQARGRLARGEIDMLAGMYKTQSRDENFDFSIPHFVASYGLFVRTGSSIRGVKDLVNASVIVQNGDLAYDYVLEHGIGAQIIAKESWDQVLAALASGEGDCAIASMVQGMFEIRQRDYRNVQVVGSPILQRPYCIAVQQGDAELLSLVNEGLNLLKISGEYDTIYQRWFGIYEQRGLLQSSQGKWLLGGAAGLLISLGIAALWLWMLRRQVAVRTRQLQQANAAKSSFLARVSHELRTPLHGIIGMQRLLAGTQLDSRQRELLDLSEASAGQLFRILSDLLDISRAESGKLSLVMSEFRAGDIATWLEPVLRTLAEEKGLQFEFRTTGSDLLIRSDRERIAQIIVNLATNAVKYTDRGSVSIQLTVSGGVFSIRVQDTGAGIAAENQAEIFAPFHQTGTASPAAGGGLGLGLSIVKTLIELLNGRVQVQSEPGLGATFIVHIPIETVAEYPGVVQAGAAAPRSDATVEPAEAPMTGLQREHDIPLEKRILVAEDEAVNRLYLKSILSGRGWEVSQVANGTAAVAAWRDGRFDLLLLDLSMPGMDGLEVARAIRGEERETGRPPVPIIALTAHAYDEDRERCARAGMEGFVSKPFTEPALFSEIKRILSIQTSGRTQA